MMGLFDQLGASASGGADVGPLADALGSIFEQSGGLQGLLKKFTDGGLGEASASWVGGGENQAVSPEQMHGALGNDLLSDMGAKLGIDGEAVASFLAQKLPGIIDQLTPDGQLDSGADAGLAGLLPSLLEKLGGSESS